MDLLIGIYIFIIGICIGSFLNVVIDRLPLGNSISKGRSKCDFCHKTLSWFELIPLLSFIIQKGTCTKCHKKISFQYPLIEFITGVVLVGIFSLPLILITSKIFLSIIFLLLLVHFMTDLKYQILLDEITIIMFLTLCLGKILGLMPNFSWLNILTSGIVSSLCFYLLYLFTKGKGLGFGDVKLVFVLGLFLGFPGALVAYYLAFLTGAIVGLILIISGAKKMKSKIAFGPFLILGTVMAFFWSNQIISWFYTLLTI